VLHRPSTGLAVVVALLGCATHAHAAAPTTQDCLAANESSISLRREFKLQAARAQLLICAAPSCPADVRKECARRVDEVNAAMPTIVFEAKDATGADVSAVRVTMDGDEPLTDLLEGNAISIDPGSHSFRFESAGFPSVEKTFVIREGEKSRRERILLGAEPAAAQTATGSAPQDASTTAATASSEAPSKPSPLPTIGLVAGGVGVVALVVGGVFGLKAKSAYDDSNEKGHCDATGCDAEGLKLRDDAFSAANVSTAFFITGGVLAAGGLTLYFVSKSQHQSAVSVSPLVATNGGGVFVRGGF